jgi:hypothetical protein
LGIGGGTTSGGVAATSTRRCATGVKTTIAGRSTRWLGAEVAAAQAERDGDGAQTSFRRAMQCLASTRDKEV